MTLTRTRSPWSPAAARGIGRGIALALAQAGADVAIAEVDRVASAAQQYRDAALSGYRRRRSRSASEIARSAGARRAIERRRDAVGRRCGDGRRRPCASSAASTSSSATPASCTSRRSRQLAEEAFDLTMAVNVKGVFLSCKAAIPVLKRAAGRLHHQRRLGGRQERRAGHGALLRVEVRRRRLHQLAGQGAGARRHPRQRHLPRHPAHADVGVPRRRVPPATTRTREDGLAALRPAP